MLLTPYLLINLITYAGLSDAIAQAYFKRFFSDEEKNSLREMYRLLEAIDSIRFAEYSENVFTIMGRGIGAENWNEMVEGFVALNSLNNEIADYLKTTKNTQIQLNDLDQFEVSPVGRSLFLRILVEQSSDNSINYIFSGTQVTFKLSQNEDSGVAFNNNARNALQEYFKRRALENIRKSKSSFLIEQ